MVIRLHPHASERMKERGATEDEVKAAVEHGEQFPVKFGRVGFRRNFLFESVWRKKHYRTKQIEVYAVREGTDWMAVMVITRYF